MRPIVGIGVSVTDVGLVLLGASVALQISAIMITPDVLQRWISRSYFGTDGGIIFEGRGSDRFCNWGAEVKALDEVIAEAKLAQKKDREAASTEHR